MHYHKRYSSCVFKCITYENITLPLSFTAAAGCW